MAVAALCVTKALSTLMRFQQYAKTHRSIRVHTAVLIRFDCPSIFLMKCSKPIELNVSWTLCASYKHAFWCVFDRFQPSSLIRYVCIFVLIHSVVGASSMRVTAGYFTTYGSFVSKLVINRVLYYSYNHCCGLMNGAWLTCVDKERHGVSFEGDRTQISRDGCIGSWNMADSLTLFTDCEWGAVWRRTGLNIGANLIGE